MAPLARRSALVLALLFGLVFAVGVGVMYAVNAPTWMAVVFALVIVGAQYALGPWIIELIYKIRWVDPASVHPDFARWYAESCYARKIPVPRFGIIEDGTPNAFTYGHTEKDARVVVTSGLVQMLTPAEVHAVVAHELGHVCNRDFVVMTLASAVPLVLYVMYVFARRLRGNRNVGYYALAVAAGAYVAYVVSQYLVLLLSRVREFFADEASAGITGDPNALSSALVKVCYGVSTQASAAVSTGKAATSGMNLAQAAAPLGIANMHSSTPFALMAADASGAFSLPVMARGMQWDLKNPWAKWFELHSTHPLPARRILALNRVAARMRMQPAYDLQQAENSGAPYTGNLMLEIVVMSLPTLLGVLGLAAGAVLASHGHVGGLGLTLCGIGAGWILNMSYAYPQLPRSGGATRDVAGLVSEVNVCHLTSIPCVVEGQIIGRGVPGLYCASDLVMRDRTGFMLLRYRQPFGFLEFMFGWLKAERYVNRMARVHGWYRRGPSPYIEVDRIEMLDGAPDHTRCYYHSANMAFAGVLCLLGGLAVVLIH